MQLMMRRAAITLLAVAWGGPGLCADEEHHPHPAPEKLGAVTFATSCRAAVKPTFERALALLHSFAYDTSEQAFRDVIGQDPTCAIAYWGMAMTHFHQLWEPPSGAELREGAAEARKAAEMHAGSLRERQFIGAVDTYYRGAEQELPSVRAERYAASMADVARGNPRDPEAQIFYALALIATASPADKSHANQRRAADILEPIYRRQPEHPGVAHYLIHAYDSAELASRGLGAARAYSKIAPSAPHALHMPSHIFTRLGLWDDSIASNEAARAAAHQQGDVGEELHAMDYLTYAYLQRGRNADAEQIVRDLRSMNDLPVLQFKVDYAATAMPVRLAVERRDWDAAASSQALPESAPHVVALVYWARALGRARAGRPRSDADVVKLQGCLDQLKSGDDPYWATQVEVLLYEAQAWNSAASGDTEAAISSLRAAAEEEDAVEKLPLTPGPIVPAREQLGELLLDLHHPEQALREFQTALSFAPRRRGALVGAITAANDVGDIQTAKMLRAELID